MGFIRDALFNRLSLFTVPGGIEPSSYLFSSGMKIFLKLTPYRAFTSKPRDLSFRATSEDDIDMSVETQGQINNVGISPENNYNLLV